MKKISGLETKNLVTSAMSRLNQFHTGLGHTKVPFPIVPGSDIISNPKKEKKKK